MANPFAALRSAGRAVLVWHAFTNAEWDVVYGYEAGKKTFLGHGSYGGEGKPYVEAPEGRTATCGVICDPLGAIAIGRKARPFVAPPTELAALKDATKHLWWNAPEGPDAARNAAAAKLLEQARDAYAAGIAEIEQALAALP